MTVFTIAEFGSSPAPFTRDRLNQFILKAAVARANAIKIQLFKADHFPNEERAAKQKLEFPRELLGWFFERAQFYGLRVGASVFDKEAIDLCTRLGSDFIKLAAREQYNCALREYAQQFKGTIFRSIDFNGLDDYEPRLPREVTLGCIPRYPTNIAPKLITDMTNKLSSGHLSDPWGWSSHTPLFDDVLWAAHLGAKVIEKHFKINSTDIEAKWSLDMNQWSYMERLLAI